MGTRHWPEDADDAVERLERELVEARRHTESLLAGIAEWPPSPKPSALTRYTELMAGEVPGDAVEALRLFLSLALTGQDWIDVEPFLDALKTQPAQEPVAYTNRWQLEHCKNEEYQKSLMPLAMWGRLGDGIDIALYTTPQPAKVERPGSKEYYWHANECRANQPTDRDCICWHPEGTGPYKEVLFINDNHLTWRDAPKQPAHEGEGHE
jgi:hypothetical protein